MFFCSAFYSWNRLDHAKIKKVILPKDTPQEDLAYKNPTELDTRNLDVAPLEDFKTIGIKDHQTELDTRLRGVSGHVVQQLHLSYSKMPIPPTIRNGMFL